MVDLSTALNDSKVAGDEFNEVLQRALQSDPLNAVKTLESILASAGDLITDAETP